MPEDRLSMRLDPVTRHDLDQLRVRLGLSVSDVVKLALREAATRRRLPSYNPSGEAQRADD